MSGLDDWATPVARPTCGHVTNIAKICTCTHSAVVHDIGTRAGRTVRTACSTMTGADGQCPCKLFKEAT